MDNSNKCYSYKEITKINQNIKLNLNDKDKRILQHRIVTINNIFHILFNQINTNRSFNKNIINKLKLNIYKKTYVNMSSKDIVKFIRNMQNENKKCKLFNNTIKKANFINNQLGGSGNNIPILNISEISNEKIMYSTINNFLTSLLNNDWVDAGYNFIEMLD
jgi:hypothetical protein